MNKINVQFIDKIDNHYTALVGVEDEQDILQYDVIVDEKYMRKLGYNDVEKLISTSFEFLLEREPKESILEEFNLKKIQKFFPEFEMTIKR